MYLIHRWDTNTPRVDQGVMAVKGYSTLPRSPEMEPHHAVWCYTQDTSFWGKSYPSTRDTVLAPLTEQYLILHFLLDISSLMFELINLWLEM